MTRRRVCIGLAAIAVAVAASAVAARNDMAEGAGRLSRWASAIQVQVHCYPMSLELVRALREDRTCRSSPLTPR
ncbi:MAG TPA: hypothetical protein VNE71_01600 [Myxococcota bacterium]|nr:hypothetical protein [Myxococcota bacterium]